MGQMLLILMLYHFLQDPEGMEDYVWPMICDECHGTNGLAE
jgi:hypothetical protein